MALQEKLNKNNSKWLRVFSIATIFALFVGIVTVSQDHYGTRTDSHRGLATVASDGAKSFDYNEMFDLTRQLFSRKEVRDFMKEHFKEALELDEITMAKFGVDNPRGIAMTETQLILLLQNNPEIWPDLKKYLKEVPYGADLDDATRLKWQEHFTKIFSDPAIHEEFKQLNNPTEALHMASADGKATIKNMGLFVNHPRLIDGVEIPKDDLVKEMIDFIDSAEKELCFNVMDFDHMGIADAIIRAHDRGVKVMGGIYKDYIDNKEHVTIVFDKMRAAGLNVQSIDSTGLNHQKLIATDWSVKGKGRALLSSGNFTHSGLDPRGDLHHLADDVRPAASVPNANHLIKMDSDLMSQVIFHQLDKTITYKMRGAEFPISGVYRFHGINASGKNFPMYLAFTPGGAYKNVNENFIGAVIRKGKGPVKMAQFAFSSQEVVDALLERAKKEVRRTGNFDFQSVGHAGFAMQYWSGFLEMSGMKKLTEGPEAGIYVDDPENQWRKLFRSQAKYEKFRENILLGPKHYRDMVYVEAPDVNGVVKNTQISAKIHHKSLLSGDETGKLGWVIAGSFNFSEGAEGNSEQIFAIKDQEFAKEFGGIVDYLQSKSNTSVLDDALRRNTFNLRELRRHVGTMSPADRAALIQTQGAIQNAVIGPSASCSKDFQTIVNARL